MGRSCSLLLLGSLLLIIHSAERVEAATAETAVTAGAKGSRLADLFVDAPSDRVLPASTILTRNTPRAGTVATMSAPGGGSQPAVKIVKVQASLLAPKGPQRISLAMPDGTKVVIRRRSDVPGVTTAAAASSSNGSVAGLVTSWFGEVVEPRGTRGPFSAVALTVAENGGLYGEISYWDVKASKKRSFQITPLTLEGVNPAAADVPDIDGVSAASLYPNVDTSRHVLMEIIEPDYKARLQHNHEQEEWLKRQQAVVTASAANSTSIDTTLPVPQSIPANLTAYYAPLQPPTDAQALAEAMAASAGPDTPKKAAGEYLAQAQSILASYSTTAGPQLPVAPIVPASDGTNDGTAGRKHRKLLQAGNAVIDWLVVYTPNAVAAAGGETNVQTQIRNTLNRINAMYVNSGVQITLNLVGMRRVSYTEASTDDGRTSLNDASNGRIPNLHAWRDELRADMVTIWTRSPGAANGLCGWAPITDGNNQGLLYSQIQHGCFNGIVVGHELGHNQGCGHLHANGNGGGITSYSHGFRRCDLGGSNNFVTVMAYGCWEVGVSTYRDAEIFSNPNYRVSNVPAGDANIAHCGRTLQETRQRIANARAGVNPPPAGGNTITSGLSASKCIDTPSWNIGTQMTVWDCHGQQNQRFEHLPDGSLRFPGTNRCLDVRGGGTADGTVVQVWDCNGTPAQTWIRDAQRRLRPLAAPSKCLDVPNTANGARLVIWECHTGANQQWNSNVFPAPFNPQNQGIRSDLNSMCLDVFAYNYNNGAPVVMWPCNGQTNQQWQLDNRGLLRSRHNTNKCLDVSNVNTGSPVVIWDCHGGGNQQWFRDSRNRLRSVAAPSKCLDVQGANPAQGTRVQLWDCIDVPQQRWQVA